MPSQTRKIVLDTGALFLGRVTGLLLGVVRLNYLATYLGVSSFGVLNFATYFTSLFLFLYDFGLPTLLTREISRNERRSRELLGATIILKAIISTVASVFLITAVLASGFDSVTGGAVLLTTLIQIINGLSLTVNSAFQAHKRMVLVSVVSVATDLTTSIAIILLIPRFPHVLAVLGITAAIAVLNLGSLLLVYRRILGLPTFRFDPMLWRSLLREGFPIAISTMGISLYMFIGPTILKYVRGEEEVGIYSAGYKLVSILTLIPTAITQVVYPIFSGFHAKEPQKLEKALRDSVRTMAEISFPLAFGVALLAPRAIALLFPEQYAPASGVLRLIIAGNGIGYLAWILNGFALATGRQRFLMWNSLVIAGFVTTASLAFIPSHGYIAVAWIFMSTDLLIFLSISWYLHRSGVQGLDFPTLARIAFAALCMGGVIFLLRSIPLLPLCLLATAVYATLLFFFRVFGDQEKEMLRKIIRL